MKSLSGRLPRKNQTPAQFKINFQPQSHCRKKSDFKLLTSEGPLGIKGAPHWTVHIGFGLNHIRVKHLVQVDTHLTETVGDYNGSQTI